MTYRVKAGNITQFQQMQQIRQKILDTQTGQIKTENKQNPKEIIAKYSDLTENAAAAAAADFNPLQKPKKESAAENPAGSETKAVLEAEMEQLFGKLADAETPQERDAAVNNIMIAQKRLNAENQKINNEKYRNVLISQRKELLNAVSAKIKDPSQAGSVSSAIINIVSGRQGNLAVLCDQLASADNETARTEIENKIQQEIKRFEAELQKLENEFPEIKEEIEAFAGNTDFQSMTLNDQNSMLNQELRTLQKTLESIQASQQKKLDSLYNQLASADTARVREQINNIINLTVKQFNAETSKIDTEIRTVSARLNTGSEAAELMDKTGGDFKTNSLILQKMNTKFGQQEQMMQLEEQLANAANEQERDAISSKMALEQKRFNAENQKISNEIYKNVMDNQKNELLKKVQAKIQNPSQADAVSSEIINTVYSMQGNLSVLYEQLASADNKTSRDQIGAKILQEMKRFEAELQKIENDFPELKEEIEAFAGNTDLQSMFLDDQNSMLNQELGTLQKTLESIQASQQKELDSLYKQLASADDTNIRNSLNNKINLTAKQFNDEISKIHTEIRTVTEKRNIGQEASELMDKTGGDLKTNSLIMLKMNTQFGQQEQMTQLEEQLANAANEQERDAISSKMALEQKRFNAENKAVNNEIYKAAAENSAGIDIESLLINDQKSAINQHINVLQKTIAGIQTSQSKELEELYNQLTAAESSEQRMELNNKIAILQRRFDTELDKINAQITQLSAALESSAADTE